nr:hypothetical protein CPGR_04924 [Mycolicibacterium malmesburyense]
MGAGRLRHVPGFGASSPGRQPEPRAEPEASAGHRFAAGYTDRRDDTQLVKLSKYDTAQPFSLTAASPEDPTDSRRSCRAAGTHRLGALRRQLLRLGAGEDRQLETHLLIFLSTFKRHMARTKPKSASILDEAAHPIRHAAAPDRIERPRIGQSGEGARQRAQHRWRQAINPIKSLLCIQFHRANNFGVYEPIGKHPHRSVLECRIPRARAAVRPEVGVEKVSAGTQDARHFIEETGELRVVNGRLYIDDSIKRERGVLARVRLGARRMTVTSVMLEPVPVP